MGRAKSVGHVMVDVERFKDEIAAELNAHVGGFPDLDLQLVGHSRIPLGAS